MEFRNQLLRALPPDATIRLTPSLEKVALVPGEIIEPNGQPVTHVYFPESGVASLLAFSQTKKPMEAGPFGREGMSGLAVIHQVDTPLTQTVVQVAGEAYRVEARVIAELAQTRAEVQRIFLRYAYAFSVQFTQTALSAGIGSVERRLARWLLMLHDRIDGDEIALTHDYMALMLAVRRPGVTVALHLLEGKGLIRSFRGRLIVRDRQGLLDLCGDIYGVPETVYKRFLLEAEAD